jgi:pyruvate,water dikinase
MAPLTIGTAPRLLPDVIAGAVAKVARRTDTPEDAIVGQPASPGRATGAVRVVGGTDDFARFQPGEILVARTMAPAWTPLLTRAAAVVTDGGTLAAHASLIAREYGIPAVVATGDATARLRDGQIVTVNGSAGVVLT